MSTTIQWPAQRTRHIRATNVGVKSQEKSVANKAVEKSEEWKYTALGRIGPGCQMESRGRNSSSRRENRLPGAAPGISPQFHSFRTNAQLSHCSTTEHQFDGEFLTNGRNPFNVRSSKMNAQNLRIFPESLSKADSSGGLNLAFIGNCTDSLQWEFFK